MAEIYLARRLKMSKKLVKIVVIAGLIFTVGCGGNKLKKETQYFDAEGNVEKVEFANTDAQDQYQKTIRALFLAALQQKPTLELSFKIIEINNLEKIIVPVIKQNQGIDWEKLLTLIERTPTTGENVKESLIGALKNLGIPLAIAGMATVAVQSARTSEELKPNTQAGGDVVQSEVGQATLDKSSTEINDIDTVEY